MDRPSRDLLQVQVRWLTSCVLVFSLLVIATIQTDSNPMIAMPTSVPDHPDQWRSGASLAAALDSLSQKDYPQQLDGSKANVASNEHPAAAAAAAAAGTHPHKSSAAASVGHDTIGDRVREQHEKDLMNHQRIAGLRSHEHEIVQEKCVECREFEHPTGGHTKTAGHAGQHH